MADSGSMLLKRWTTENFLRTMGITENPFTQLEEFLHKCEQLDPRFKGDRDLVRYELNKNPDEWDDHTRAIVMDLAGSFKMLGGIQTPFRGSADAVVAMAGARGATLKRGMHGVVEIVERRAEAKVIVFAGGTRLLRPDEIPYVEGYAFGGKEAKTEFDCIVGARDTILKRYPDLPIIAVCHDNPRARAEDIVDEVMGHKDITSLGNNLEISWITTQIYVEGLQQKLAVAQKGYPGCKFRACGHPSDPEAQFERKLDVILSECYATIKSAAIAASMGC